MMEHSWILERLKNFGVEDPCKDCLLLALCSKKCEPKIYYEFNGIYLYYFGVSKLEKGS